MTDADRRTVTQLPADKQPTGSAARRRAREAMLPHARHGRVAWVEPDETPAEHRPLNEIPEWEADRQ